MLSIITLLIVLSLSFLVTRFATVALTYTGLSKQVARFQARSAFTGVGFTTSESEQIVNHPVRRKILLTLMLFGNAGIISVVATLVATFINLDSETVPIYLRLLALFLGIIGLWAFSKNQWIDRRLSKFIGWALKKYTHLDVRDYAELLHMAGEYKVAELFIEPSDWLEDKTLQEVRLQDEGIMVLGINRTGGHYIGAPHGQIRICSEDTLILYGRESSFDELDHRQKGRKGDLNHQKAIELQRRIQEHI